MSSTLQHRLSGLLQNVAAVIMGQTLFFKFSGAPEPVYIFTTLGAEPYGRWLAAVSELVAVVLLLWPALAGVGGLLGLGIMSGALMAHLTTKLGIEVLGDGGLLFAWAWWCGWPARESFSFGETSSWPRPGRCVLDSCLPESRVLAQLVSSSWRLRGLFQS
jgi:hypothetical protein